MPGDGLPLAVHIGGEVDGAGALGDALELRDDLALAADGLVLGLEVVLEVDPELALGQVADMPHRGLHDEVLAQVLVDRARLGGALDDHQGLLLGGCALGARLGGRLLVFFFVRHR